MSNFQARNFKTCKETGWINQEIKNQSIETGPEEIQTLELLNEDFMTIINMLKELKETMSKDQRIV